MDLEERLRWGDIVRIGFLVAIAIILVLNFALIVWLILATISWIEAKFGSIAGLVAVCVLGSAVTFLPSQRKKNLPNRQIQ